MIIRRIWLVLLTVVLASTVAACGGSDEPSIDIKPGQVDIGAGDAGITVEGPSGDVSIGTGDLPDGWPAGFPIPDGATPVYSINAEGDVAAWFASDQSSEEIKAFFTSALPAAGYEVQTTDITDPNGSYTAMSITGNGMSGGIYMGDNLGQVAIGFQGDFDFWVTLSPQ